MAENLEGQAMRFTNISIMEVSIVLRWLENYSVNVSSVGQSLAQVLPSESYNHMSHLQNR